MMLRRDHRVIEGRFDLPHMDDVEDSLQRSGDVQEDVVDLALTHEEEARVCLERRLATSGSLLLPFFRR